MPTGTPLIQFETLRAPRNSTESRLYSKLRFPLGGDWLNDPPDMAVAERLVEQAINETASASDAKYSRTFTFIHHTEAQPGRPAGIYIYSNWVTTSQKELICRFIPFALTSKEVKKKIKNDFCGFEYNQAGFCMKPKIMLQHVKGDLFYSVYISRCRVGWLAGYEFNPGDLHTAISKPPNIKGEMFSTELLATYDAARGLVEEIGNYDFQLLAENVEYKPLKDFLFNTETNINQLNFKKMAKQTGAKPQQETAPAAAAGTAKNRTQQIMVKLSSIIPSPTNKFHREPWELDEKKDNSFAELVNSIRAHGVNQSVLLRPNSEPGMYYLVCGERRFTAAEKAGLDEVPAIIKILNDDEAFEAQIIENLQRKDVHPLREAESYSAYMKQNNSSLEDMSAKFSKTSDYIRQRLSFMQLIPEFKKDFLSNKMNAGQAALFARLAADDQLKCLQECKSHDGADNYKHISEIKSFVNQSLMGMLNSVAFNLTDEKLHVPAGSCANCQTRSGAGLFSDIGEKDRCFNLGCMKIKASLHTLNELVGLLESNPEMPIVKLNHGDGTKEEVKKLMLKKGLKSLVKWHDFEEATKETPKAVRALVIAGTQAGHYVYIKLKKAKPQYNSSPGTGTSGKAAPVIDKKAQEITVATLKVKDIETNIAKEYENELEKQLFDFKPYLEPDDKALTKYEMAIFLMALDDELYGGTVNKYLDKVVPAGIKKADKGYEVEKFAAIPPGLQNLMMRRFIVQHVDNIYSDENTYILNKLAGENKALQTQALKAAVEKKFKKQLDEAKEKLQALQFPPKETTGPVKPGLNGTVVKAVKKAAGKKVAKK